MPLDKPKRIPRSVKVLVLSALLILAAWWPVKLLLIRAVGISELTVGWHLVMQRLGWTTEAAPTTRDADGWRVPTTIELDESILPYRQIGGRLGPRGRANNLSLPRGAAIFDANGDGRLDLYFLHSGRPVAKATSEDHVLTDEPVAAKPCTLFLNLGNDDAGDPVFKSVQDLQAEGNGEYVRQELLVENKYQPRSSLEEDEFAAGRIGVGAVAADFNGDGRLDLYVLNSHYGLMGQTHELGFRAYPARNNLGRQARRARQAVVLRNPSFLWGERSDGMVTTVELGGRREAEGRNTFYLNLGDRDGDGIPEWEDATDALDVGGRWTSTGAAVADFDRDGDLDLYVANFLDPDFWGFGSDRFAGNRNQLYVNQLSDTGKLGFLNRAEELGVAGLHDEEGLEASIWLPDQERLVPTSEQVVEGRQVGEKADHTWAAGFADWNHDHWPDLVVANDQSNRLRVYENLQGRGFRYLEAFNESLWDGCWMGMSVGDLDGDLKEEVLVTNCGSQTMSVRNNALVIEDTTAANVVAAGVLNYPHGRATLHHALLSHRPEGFRELAKEVEVKHSPYIPPDVSMAVNFAPGYLDFYEQNRFATSLTAYEFAWNAPMFDVDNDGDLDLYLAGSLSRGNDGFMGDWSGSPGRLLVNESTPGELAFRDLTLEYRLLDITHMDYTSNPPRRPAPGTGWHKRDYIYLTDTDGYAGAGIDAAKSAVRDIFRMHEAASAVLAADLNNDGYQDLVLTHSGGYTSVSPEARNLKVEFAGRILAVPAPNKVANAPTSFEEGETFVYINGGPPRGSEGRWVHLRLTDRESANRYGVGARVIVNGKMLRRPQIGGSAFGATTSQDLHVGLGAQELNSLEITWPSGDPTPQILAVEPPVHNRRICVDRQEGVVPCDPGPDL